MTAQQESRTPPSDTAGAVCVFCGSATTVVPAYLALAREVGTALASAGHVVVSGGGKVGMMGAVTAGAREAGGRTVGVIPRVLSDAEIADVDSDELVVTTDLSERKNTMVARSDAFLALPGGIGTLDELFEVWTSGYLNLHAKPVVLLSPGGFYDHLLAHLDAMVAADFLTPGSRALLRVAATVPDALRMLDPVRL